MRRPRYQHTQPGWALRLAFVTSAVLLAAIGAAAPAAPATLPRLSLWLGAALTLALGWLWSSLTIRVDAESLQARFGLGWPRTTTRLADIESVEVTRTTLLNGWGVHRTRRGWLYNASGYDAVLITRKDGRALLLGTDEPRRLKAALERAIGQSG